MGPSAGTGREFPGPELRRAHGVLGGALARVGSQPGLGPLQRSGRGPGGAAEDSVGVPVVPRRPGALPGRPHNRSGGSPVYRRIRKRTGSRCWSCWTGAIRSRNTASARINVQNNNLHSRPGGAARKSAPQAPSNATAPPCSSSALVASRTGTTSYGRPSPPSLLPALGFPLPPSTSSYSSGSI